MLAVERPLIYTIIGCSFNIAHWWQDEPLLMSKGFVAFVSSTLHVDVY